MSHRKRPSLRVTNLRRTRYIVAPNNPPDPWTPQQQSSRHWSFKFTGRTQSCFIEMSFCWMIVCANETNFCHVRNISGRFSPDHVDELFLLLTSSSAYQRIIRPTIIMLTQVTPLQWGRLRAAGRSSVVSPEQKLRFWQENGPRESFVCSRFYLPTAGLSPLRSARFDFRSLLPSAPRPLGVVTTATNPPVTTIHILYIYRYSKKSFHLHSAPMTGLSAQAHRLDQCQSPTEQLSPRGQTSVRRMAQQKSLSLSLCIVLPMIYINSEETGRQ